MTNSSSTKYINIVSGKGGTGKTLLCTILAELLGNQNVSVLIIDMDIFVRGLTALLYFHKGESINIAKEDEITVSDIFYLKQKLKEERLAIHRYRSFDICPAVTRINQIFDFERETMFDIEYNHKMFQELYELIPKGRYDYVFFDCRAGYDSLVSTIHEKSDVTICVQEEDDISDVTANNLIRQLERDSSQKPIFKIVNKARNVRSFEDIDKKQKRGQGLLLLGYIPFDMDVMNSFGEKTFWEDISKSLYKAAVAETWNNLAKKIDIQPYLHYKRFSPLFSTALERPFGFMKTPTRVFAFMGLILSSFSFLYMFMGGRIEEYFRYSPDKFISFIIGITGVFIFVYSVLIKRRD